VIVIESSAIVDALVGDPANPSLLALLAEAELHAPALLDLRDNLTVYDAAYLVLAQALPASVVSADAKLREASRLGVDMRVFQ
jgi:predicted nucleic acid-binding protein